MGSAEIRKGTMKPPTKSLAIVGFLQREVNAALRLSPWVLATLLLAALLWHPELAATGGLFQSPQDTPTPTPIPAPTLAPTATTEIFPSATAEAPVPAATETAEAPPAPPTETPVLAVTATLVPTNSPTPTAVPTETPVIPTATLAPVLATSTPISLEQDGTERYPEEDSNLLFNWTMLFDSVALGLSYVWLCCGVLVLVGVPIFFVALWVAGRRRQQGEE